jgi:hypothetical protein
LEGNFFFPVLACCTPKKSDNPGVSNEKFSFGNTACLRLPYLLLAELPDWAKFRKSGDFFRFWAECFLLKIAQQFFSSF